MTDVVDNVINNYAYDKETQTLYVLTSNSNCAVMLNKDYAKIIKKAKDIPHLEGAELNAAILKANKSLDDKFTEINRLWTIHVQDSISKAKSDSLELVRHARMEMDERNQQLDEYRSGHNWHWLPVNNHALSCTLCDKTFSEDSVFCLGIRNDSIYYGKWVEGDLGLSYFESHVCQIPPSLLTDASFKYHYEAFQDSLSRDTFLSPDFISSFNNLNIRDYIKQLKKAAPYGYFDSWGWDGEYSMITFNFKYTNTNAMTIRYIDVYFRVTNDVHDVRLTGHFKGTGPLKELETASWDWDSSSYFVAGDASKMNITKVILTFMNGRQKVLTGRLLQFSNSDDEE
jgi:hypothetical protein